MSTSWDLLVELVRTNFKLKYKGSILGFVWVLLKPFFIFLLLYIVFANLLKIGGSCESSGKNAMYLLIGLIVYNYFSEGIIFGMNSILDKSNMILKVNFNRIIAVLSSLILAFINFLINSIIIAVVAVIVGVDITPVSFVYVLLLVLTMSVIILSISLFSSLLLIRLRDLTHIVELALQLVFYGSAVFYPISIVPDRWRFLIDYNPIAAIIDASRTALIDGEVARMSFAVSLLAVALLLLLVGIPFFNRSVKLVAEYI